MFTNQSKSSRKEYPNHMVHRGFASDTFIYISESIKDFFF